MVNHGNVIGAGIRVEGSVQGSGDLDIEGTVSGSVELSGDLDVHTGAEIDGTVSATSLEVAGTIRGPVTAERRVSISASGVIEGDVSAPEPQGCVCSTHASTRRSALRNMAFGSQDTIKRTGGPKRRAIMRMAALFGV